MHPFQDDIDMKALRARSSRIFGGAEFRAEIGLVVGRSETVCKSELGRALVRVLDDPPSPTTINNEIDLLIDARLLEADAPHPRNGKKHWKPVKPCAYWDFCAELAERSRAS